MKKLLNLLGAMGLGLSTIPAAIAGSSYQPQAAILHRNKREGNFKKLRKELKKWMLGELPDNRAETILNRIYKLNKNFTKNSLRIIDLNENIARIIWYDDTDTTTNYIDVSFSIYDLGNSIFYHVQASLRANRPLPPLPISPVTRRPLPPIPTVPAPTPVPKKEGQGQGKPPAYATVIPKSQRKKPSTILQSLSPTNLNNLLPNTDLGELPDNLPETIFERLILRNTDIDLDQVTLHDITPTLAIISSNANSTRYHGRVIVHFTLNTAEVKPIKKNKNNPNSDSDSDSDKSSFNKLIWKFNMLLSPNDKTTNFSPKKVLTENTPGGRFQAEDTIFGTSNGVYIRQNDGKIIKFNNLNSPIIGIELNNNESAYVINNSGKIYYLNLNTLESKPLPTLPKITSNINLNWKVTGPITNDKKVEDKTINLIKWSNYANSHQEFKEKYKQIKLNNFRASAGGQGTTVSNHETNVEFKTENITENKNNEPINHLSMIKYDFVNYVPMLFINYVKQSARLYIKNLFFEGEYLKMEIVSFTYSWMAVYHAWTNLKIDKVQVY